MPRDCCFAAVIDAVIAAVLGVLRPVLHSKAVAYGVVKIRAGYTSSSAVFLGRL